MKKPSVTISIIAAVFMLVCIDIKPLWAAKSQPPDTDIWMAAARGNIEAIKQHLEAGTDVDAKQPPGSGTPLLVAATFGRAEAAKFLIEKGANVNASSNDGATALHGAAFFCHAEIVKLLLDKGAKVNAKQVVSGTLETPTEP